MIFQVSGLVYVLKMRSRLFPNRIIDAEGVRKPLDRPLDGSWSGLEGSRSALGVLLDRPKGPDPPKTGSEGAQGELSWRSDRAWAPRGPPGSIARKGVGTNDRSKEFLFCL